MEATAICVPVKEHDSLATDADSINLAYPGNRKSRAKSQTHTQGVLMEATLLCCVCAMLVCSCSKLFATPFGSKQL